MTDVRSASSSVTTLIPGQTTLRTLPILQVPPPIIQTSAPSPGDPMDMADLTPPASAMMAPPSRTSPDNETNGHDHMGMGDQLAPGNLAGPNAAAAAAAGSQQPKVVQTAFIHKLYKYVEVVAHGGRIC